MASVFGILQPEIEGQLFADQVLGLLLGPNAGVEITVGDPMVLVSGQVDAVCPLIREDRDELADMAEYLAAKTGIDEPGLDWLENPSGFGLLNLFLKDGPANLLYHWEQVLPGEYEFLLFSNGDGPDFTVVRQSGVSHEQMVDLLKDFKGIFS
jgi:hypothetical protein